MEFKDLTIDEANLIVTALAELPFKASAALIQKLQAQGKAQLEQKKPESWEHVGAPGQAQRPVVNPDGAKNIQPC